MPSISPPLRVGKFLIWLPLQLGFKHLKREPNLRNFTFGSSKVSSVIDSALSLCANGHFKLYDRPSPKTLIKKNLVFYLTQDLLDKFAQKQNPPLFSSESVPANCAFFPSRRFQELFDLPPITVSLTVLHLRIFKLFFASIKVTDLFSAFTTVKDKTVRNRKTHFII